MWKEVFLCILFFILGFLFLALLVNSKVTSVEGIFGFVQSLLIAVFDLAKLGGQKLLESLQGLKG